MQSGITLIVVFGAFGLLLTLAYLAEREQALKWLVYAIVGLTDLAMIPLGLLLAAMPRLTAFDPGSSEQVSEVLAQSGMAGESWLQLVGDIGLVVMAMGIAGLIVLLPPIRRLIAIALPIDPSRVVHAVALQYVVLLVGFSLVTGLAMGVVLGDDEALEQMSELTAEGGLGTLWAQSVGFVLLALLGVGIGVQRNAREALSRLGLTRQFSIKWWIAATGLALIASIGIDYVWEWMASENLAEVERLSEALFEPYLSLGLIGALTIGLSAGIGEEILFRGAAQTRLGLIFTSVLFGVLHTQYTISPALIQVFLVGLLLGICRQRSSTTTAIGVHASYNFVLASFAIYGGG